MQKEFLFVGLISLVLLVIAVNQASSSSVGEDRIRRELRKRSLTPTDEVTEKPVEKVEEQPPAEIVEEKPAKIVEEKPAAIIPANVQEVPKAEPFDWDDDPREKSYSMSSFMDAAEERRRPHSDLGDPD